MLTAVGSTGSTRAERMKVRGEKDSINDELRHCWGTSIELLQSITNRLLIRAPFVTRTRFHFEVRYPPLIVEGIGGANLKSKIRRSSR